MNFIAFFIAQTIVMVSKYRHTHYSRRSKKSLESYNFLSVFFYFPQRGREKQVQALNIRSGDQAVFSADEVGQLVRRSLMDNLIAELVPADNWGGL